jgi:2-oxoglutarate dehydrogenase E2 component (dihydrolipoamide succinyltransferase)
MATNIVMPKLGESVTEGTIGKWLKQKGDSVAMYEPIVEVITDKVNSEIPAPAAGVLLEVFAPEGATVNVGTLIAMIGQVGETVEVSKSQPTHSITAPKPAVVQATTRLADQATIRPSDQATVRLSPVVARLAAEHNVDVTQIKGTGEGGRVTKKDIEAFIAQRAATPAPTPAPQPIIQPIPQPTIQPTIQPTSAGMADEELVPLTPMRKAIAEHMVRSAHTSPHVTTVFEVDMSKVVAHRNARKEEFAKQGADLTYTAYFAEVVARVLREQPRVNSSFKEQGIVLKKAINLGIAVALDDGLIVPVLKNADELNLLGLARGINDLSKRAREKRLKPDEVQGGTFTITNLGGSGALFGTPIINQPQVAIMGVGSIAKRAVVIDDAIAIRPMVYLSLSFDHRVLDGADGDRFLGAVKKYLESYA